jgi:hypothetical protein
MITMELPMPTADDQQRNLVTRSGASGARTDPAAAGAMGAPRSADFPVTLLTRCSLKFEIRRFARQAVSST